jgi:acetyl esterase/lipase
MIRTVRANASEWKIDPTRIGIWGFSAGGHLAASAGTFVAPGESESEDPVERESARPDFMILSYPVISMEPPLTHDGSSMSLTEGDPELMRSLSLQNAVTPQTPPAFLFHTDADEAVPTENSVMFYQALRKAKVPAEMHIFKDGWHGLGLKTMGGQPHPYMNLLRDWLIAFL